MISDERLKKIAEDDYVQCGDAAAMAKELLALRKPREGWRLVPAEPTDGMINAALATGAYSIRTAYSAMLAAAPEPPC